MNNRSLNTIKLVLVLACRKYIILMTFQMCIQRDTGWLAVISLHFDIHPSKVIMYMILRTADVRI